MTDYLGIEVDYNKEFSLYNYRNTSITILGVDFSTGAFSTNTSIGISDSEEIPKNPIEINPVS